MLNCHAHLNVIYLELTVYIQYKIHLESIVFIESLSHLIIMYTFRVLGFLLIYSVPFSLLAL
jgi:hypothetical protein